MKKLPSTLTNMALVLTLISVVAASALAYVNEITKEPIRANEERTLSEGINSVLGGGNANVLHVDTIEDTTPAIIYSTDQGKAVQAIDANGFGGPITVLVGFADDGSIKGYTVLKHAETPGLGAKVGQWFQAGAKGNIIGMKPGEKPLSVTKDDGQVDAITASTITSRAFLRAVNAAYDAFAQSPTSDNVNDAAQQQEPASAPADSTNC
ncbi:MAG: RnfABCDGE type electron transport complex subunit G [Bacteroidaceae bacterium]|nr:RnfABCDGE type electron transport complex subunit G [Bacteroidaceae bacterium]